MPSESRAGVPSGRITSSLEAIARIAQALDVSLDHLVFDDIPRRPLHAPDHGLADRLTALAELDETDRQSLLSVLDALLTRTRVRALANNAAERRDGRAGNRSPPHRRRDPAHPATVRVGSRRRKPAGSEGCARSACSTANASSASSRPGPLPTHSARCAPEAVIIGVILIAIGIGLVIAAV